MWNRLGTQFTSILISAVLISAQVLSESFAEFDIGDGDDFGASANQCKRIGDRYVHDYIQYECFTSESSDTSRIIGKPIGCVPTNTIAGPIVLPGATFTGQHFRYECQRGRSNAVSLRVTHCVDNNAELVKIGDFFSKAVNSTDFNNASMTTTTARVECVGDTFLAKKIVHKWSNCRLKNGETLIEGNFITQDMDVNELRSQLQKSEILSCLREDGQVALKCTGCVAMSGEHIAISKYLRLDSGQWTQCRRLKNGCRLLNVSSDYIDCEYEGRKFAHGSSFKSESGLSLFHCNYGVITKKGCLINGNLVLVGDVRYIDDRPLLCAQSDQLVQFNSIVGCDLPSGKFRRFLEVWRDDRVMKRCSWITPTVADASVAESRVISFACIDGKEVIPLNKIVQRRSGDYYKCAPPLSMAGDILRDNFVEDDVPLEMRAVSAEELIEHIKKKSSRLDLREYFGVGSRSNLDKLATDTRPETCEDVLPFCGRLKSYCNSVRDNNFGEPGLAIVNGHSNIDDVEARFEGFSNVSKRTSKPGCENSFTSVQKLQGLVQISCLKTCGRCNQITEKQKERLIADLERTSQCGRQM